jgi:hypothetical protein
MVWRAAGGCGSKEQELAYFSGEQQAAVVRQLWGSTERTASALAEVAERQMHGMVQAVCMQRMMQQQMSMPVMGGYSAPVG